ncbi:MAG: J domain-containing protein [Candidatus Kapabacteria bacterium]|nr:J domain-containing protein [Candidatus Kapabacteria bacterium]
MEDYFKGITTIPGANRRYRKLALEHHPDLNSRQDAGEVMRTIMMQYQQVIARLGMPSMDVEAPADTSKVVRDRRAEVVTNVCNELHETQPLEIGLLIDQGRALAEQIALFVIRRVAERLTKRSEE